MKYQWIILIVLCSFSCRKNSDGAYSTSLLEANKMSVVFNNEVIRIEALYKPISYLIQLDNQFSIMDSLAYEKSKNKYRNNYFFDLIISGKGRDEFIKETNFEKEIYLETKDRIIQPTMIHHEALMNLTPYRRVLLMFPRKNNKTEDLKLLIQKGSRYIDFMIDKNDIESFPKNIIKNTVHAPNI